MHTNTRLLERTRADKDIDPGVPESSLVVEDRTLLKTCVSRPYTIAHCSGLVLYAMV